jgi:hypothetical protein
MTSSINDKSTFVDISPASYPMPERREGKNDPDSE